MLATLRLDPARTRLVSGFLDTYLRLTAREQRLFESEIESVPDEQKESVMEITTSWKEEGIQQGTARTVLRVIARRFGPVPAESAARVSALPVDALDRLAEEWFDFSTLADLERWLALAGRRRP